MFWLPITIFAYALNAISIVINKFLLSNKNSNPVVYTFFIAALSLVGLVMIPFGFHFYSVFQIIIALVTGVIFTFALLYMFKAISGNEASRVTPFMGGLQPIFIFILALIFLGEKLNAQSLLAFFVIIMGTVVISLQKNSGQTEKQAYLFAVISTFLFAVSYTMNKYVFINQDFISGFVWTRVGSFIGALLLLIPAKNLLDVKAEIRNPQKQTGGLFFAAQTAGALSFVLVNYAIAISDSVALVNALRGTEYVFLLIIVFSLSWKFPHLLEEKMTPASIIKKVTATALIIAGLFILFV